MPDGHSPAAEVATDIEEEVLREAPPDPDAQEEDQPVFDDPGCPEMVEAIEDRTCDPLAGESSCPFGWECFPYVEYPETRCSAEVYGTRCEPAGLGVQGDACDLTPCAGGFLCVATSQGSLCAQLCELPGDGDNCPRGLICGSVDIKGYGVCF